MHRWICDFIFRKYMNADCNEMATKLKISERMLDCALKRDDSVKARLVFELCLRYCIDRGIDVNEVLKSYFRDEE